LGGRCWFWLPFALCLLLALSPDTSWAEQAEPSNSPSSSNESSNPTVSWDSFESLSQMLEAEAIGLSSESKQLLSELQESRTEVNGLRSSLALSAQSLEDFERSMKAERLVTEKILAEEIRARAVAEKSSRINKFAALLASAIAALGWSAFAISMFF
jgi:hypothetical protein